jgi:hypothetical protein
MIPMIKTPQVETGRKQRLLNEMYWLRLGLLVYPASDEGQSETINQLCFHLSTLWQCYATGDDSAFNHDRAVFFTRKARQAVIEEVGLDPEELIREAMTRNGYASFDQLKPITVATEVDSTIPVGDHNNDPWN